MDGQTIVAIIAAVIAALSAFVAGRQAVHARDQARSSERAANAAVEQAEAAKEQAEQSRRQAEVSEAQLAAMKEQQSSQEKADQRMIIIDLLHSGRAWAAQAETMVMMLGGIRGFFAKNNDVVHRYGNARIEFEQALVRARVGTLDAATAALVKMMSEYQSSMGVHFQYLDQAQRDARDHVPEDDMGNAFHVVWSVGRMLDKLEEAAAGIFGVKVDVAIPESFKARLQPGWRDTLSNPDSADNASDD